MELLSNSYVHGLQVCNIVLIKNCHDVSNEDCAAVLFINEEIIDISENLNDSVSLQ